MEKNKDASSYEQLFKKLVKSAGINAFANALIFKFWLPDEKEVPYNFSYGYNINLRKHFLDSFYQSLVAFDNIRCNADNIGYIFDSFSFEGRFSDCCGDSSDLTDNMDVVYFLEGLEESMYHLCNISTGIKFVSEQLGTFRFTWQRVGMDATCGDEELYMYNLSVSIPDLQDKLIWPTHPAVCKILDETHNISGDRINNLIWGY